MRSVPFLVLLLLSAAYGASATLTHQFAEGVITLTLDDTRTSVASIKKYLVVHPIGYDSQYHLSGGVRLCIEGQAGYKDCGSRDIHAQFFFENATHNLRLAKDRLAYLDDLKEFSQLQPLVDYFRNSLRFSIWKDERLLAYYRSWDPAELERDYESLPIIKETRAIVADLKNTKDIDARWDLSHYKWANAVNDLYRAKEGDPPRHVWAQFLKKRGITEVVKYEEID